MSSFRYASTAVLIGFSGDSPSFCLTECSCPLPGSRHSAICFVVAGTGTWVWRLLWLRSPRLLFYGGVFGLPIFFRAKIIIYVRSEKLTSAIIYKTQTCPLISEYIQKKLLWSPCLTTGFEGICLICRMWGRLSLQVREEFGIFLGIGRKSPYLCIVNQTKQVLGDAKQEN